MRRQKTEKSGNNKKSLPAENKTRKQENNKENNNKSLPAGNKSFQDLAAKAAITR